jgi:hypothetical protein
MYVSTRGRSRFPSVLLQPLGHLSVSLESNTLGFCRSFFKRGFGRVGASRAACGPTLGIENEVAPVQQRLSVAHPPRVGSSFVGAHHSLKVTLVPQGAQGTRLPFAACPGSRKVLINSPSPHTVMPEKRLYHSPSGISGSSPVAQSGKVDRFGRALGTRHRVVRPAETGMVRDLPM